MQVVFNKLIMHNFLSYAHSEYEFNKSGFIAVKGYNRNKEDNASSNGTGKSTFSSAIIWCLTGSTPTGVKDVHNRYVKEDETWVYLSFTVDGKEYTVKRFYKPAGMEFTVDGREIENKGIRDAENILSQYLPNITEKLLSSVIILGQGLPNKLTNHTPSGRKEILEQLSNSDFMIEDIKDRLSKRLTRD